MGEKKIYQLFLPRKIVWKHEKIAKQSAENVCLEHVAINSNFSMNFAMLMVICHQDGKFGTRMVQYMVIWFVTRGVYKAYISNSLANSQENITIVNCSLSKSFFLHEPHV